MNDDDLVDDGAGNLITYRQWKEAMEHAASRGWVYKDADGNFRLTEAGAAVGSTVAEA